jgi:hypothetical protein
MIKHYINMRGTNSLMILVFSLVLIINFVSATNIGVSPASLNFEQVLRGGYSEKYITISVDTEDEVKGTISFRGEIEEWMNSSEYNFTVKKSNPQRILVSISPETDIPNQNYTGFMRIFVDSNAGAIDQQAVGVVKTALDLAINLEIVDFEIKECSAKDFIINSVEKGDPLLINVSISNRGNIRLKPVIESKIWDQDQLQVVKTELYQKQEIKPTKEDFVTFEINTADMEVGQYWIELSAIDCYANQLLTFDILEPGAYKSNGYIKSIIAPSWTDVKKTVNVSALFVNTGERTVNARFVGKIMLGERTIQKIESDPVSVQINEEFPFQIYFTPQTEGKYILSGRVFYDSKRTFEKSAIINVQSSGFDFVKMITYIIYGLLIAGIAYLIYRIRIERREIFSKFR